MGILQSKKMEQKEKQDIENGTAKEAAAKKETDFNHGEANDLTGNLNNTANTSQELGPTQLISHQLEDSNGNEAMLSRMHQVPAVDAPWNREQSICNSGVSASVQVPTQVLCKDTSPQVECSFGSKEQQEMIPQIPASKMQAPVNRTRRGVRGVTTENLHIKEAETQAKSKNNKLPSQKSNCVLSHVNEASPDLTCLATDKTDNIAELNTTTKPGIAEVPATMPTGPPDHSRQMSSQPIAQVDNEENALHKHRLNHNSVTIIAEEYQYYFSAKSESSRAEVTNMRLRRKLAKNIKAQSGGDGKSFRQTAEETVVTVQESSQQRGCTAMEESTIKKHNEPHQVPQPNKADNDTNGNTSIQNVNVKTAASQVPVVEGIPTAAPNDAATHNPTTAAPDTSIRLQQELRDTAVKPKIKCTLEALNQNQPKNTGNVTMKEEMNGKTGQVEKEKQEPAITSAVTPELVCAEGRWHPFIVNQCCSHTARCRHNPGTGLPPNVQKWFYECPKHLCEPPRIIRARLPAFTALRATEEEGEDSHQ